VFCAHGQGQKREQKHTTKNFAEFYNHSPLLTMSPVKEYLLCILLARQKFELTNQDSESWKSFIVLIHADVNVHDVGQGYALC